MSFFSFFFYRVGWVNEKRGGMGEGCVAGPGGGGWRVWRGGRGGRYGIVCTEKVARRKTHKLHTSRRIKLYLC